MKWYLMIIPVAMLVGCATRVEYVAVPMNVPVLARPLYMTEQDMAAWTDEQVAKAYLVDLAECKAYGDKQHEILKSLKLEQ